MTQKKVAICIGHSRAGDKGAINTESVSEWEFNNPLAERTAELLREAGYDVRVWNKYSGSGYSGAMIWIAKQVNEYLADLAVELHFNSAAPTANGHEFLYWHGSNRSASLASCFHQSFKKFFPQRKARGAKPVLDKRRGSAFLRRTNCPAVILEPYFGSNADETIYYSARREELARAYTDAVVVWLG